MNDDLNDAVYESKKVREYLTNISERLSDLDDPVTDVVCFVRTSRGRDIMYWNGDNLLCYGAAKAISTYLYNRIVPTEPN